MYQLSLWAKHNKWKARTAIIVSHILIIILGLIAGDLLDALKFSLPDLFVWAITMMAIGGFVFYPSKRSYVQQKCCDAILIGSTFLFMMFFGNRLNNSNTLFVQPLYGSLTKSVQPPASGNKKETRLTKKESRKKIREIRRQYRKMSTALQIVLIVLVAAAAYTLIGFVAALACSLSCSGSGAAAVIVSVLGLGGIIFGTIKLIQVITKDKNKKPKKATEKTEDDINGEEIKDNIDGTGGEDELIEQSHLNNNLH